MWFCGRGAHDSLSLFMVSGLYGETTEAYCVTKSNKGKSIHVFLWFLFVYNDMGQVFMMVCEKNSISL